MHMENTLNGYTIWVGLSLKTISRYCPFKYPMFYPHAPNVRQYLLSSQYPSKLPNSSFLFKFGQQIFTDDSRLVFHR